MAVKEDDLEMGQGVYRELGMGLVYSSGEQAEFGSGEERFLTVEDRFCDTFFIRRATVTKQWR